MTVHVQGRKAAGCWHVPAFSLWFGPHLAPSQGKLRAGACHE